MSDDKRQDLRLGIRLEVELKYDGVDSAILHTRDLSQNGVYLEKGEQQPLPAVGAIVSIQVKQALSDGDPPIVKAEVIRCDSDGIALRFLHDE